MAKATWFKLPPRPGGLLPRYCVLGRDGRTVMHVQASVPDGVEVPAPRDPVFMVSPRPIRTGDYVGI